MKEQAIDRKSTIENLFRCSEHRKIPRVIRITVPVLMFTMILLTVVFAFARKDHLMANFLAVNLGLNLCGMAMLFFLSIAVFLDVSPQDTSSVLFTVLTCCIFLGLFSNDLAIIAAESTRFLRINRAATFLCCLFSPLTLFCYCCYQEALFDAGSKYRKPYLLTLGALAFADLLLYVFNLKFGYIYAIGADGVYIPGSLYSLYIIYPLIAMISSMVMTRRILAFAPRKGIVLLVFFLLFLLAGVLIATSKWIDCTYVFLAMGALFIYGTIQANRGKEIAEKNEILARQAVELVRQEQQIMISQINPHFLYNTLSTIECLCETDPLLAGETVHNLADYLRGNVDTLQNMAPIPFSREMEHLGHYVEIERLRFPHIRVEYDLADREFSLPSLTVQPMVENAIRYGVRSLDSGKITVRSYFDNMTHYIEIEDNGCGFDVNAPKKEDGRTHIGISNVRSRLEKMVNGDLSIISKPGAGTKVIISIPAKKEDTI